MISLRLPQVIMVVMVCNILGNGGLPVKYLISSKGKGQDLSNVYYLKSLAVVRSTEPHNKVHFI